MTICYKLPNDNYLYLYKVVYGDKAFAEREVDRLNKNKPSKNNPLRLDGQTVLTEIESFILCN